MSKKIIFFIALFHLTAVTNIALSEIIPPKKPLQTKEVTQKKLLKDILTPLPKPIKKTETKIVKEKVTVKQKKSGFILPKKKPLIAGSKKVSDIKISKYFNKKDFNLANKAISEMKKAKWPNALKTAKKAKDKSIYKR
ncbi:hypothetical protein IDG49_01185 [Pelagibacterales bacterium SAG-MED07]|nr:hypothetical protein [Pelagibacterales bacterium SAG-MED07]